MAELRKIAIVGSARIPFCRAYTGYAEESNLSMLARRSSGLSDKYGLKGQSDRRDHGRRGDLATAATSTSRARRRSTPVCRRARRGRSLQIACGTSLQAALNLGAKIATGEIESGIACGTDTVSDSPVVFGTKFQHRLIAINRARTPQEKLAALKGFKLGELAPVAPSTQEPRTGLSAWASIAS